jgi:hypothetical protein
MQTGSHESTMHATARLVEGSRRWGSLWDVEIGDDGKVKLTTAARAGRCSRLPKNRNWTRRSLRWTCSELGAAPLPL